MTGARPAFHITLHARPPGSWPNRILQLDGLEAPALDIPPARLATPFGMSFEQAFEQLVKLPRMFIEPDGSFVWVAHREATRPWQIDGVLYDRDERLLYVELKGHCPGSAFNELQAACGIPPAACVVQLVRHAAILDVAEFHRIWLGH